MLFTAPSSCLVLHQWFIGGGITAASGTLSWHSSYLTYPGMPVHVLALQVPSLECYASPKQLPSYMGYWKARVLVWPLHGPAEPPGACCHPQHSAPEQSLLPTEAGQVGKERRGHSVLASQCEWCGWHSAQSSESSCPLLYKYLHKATCAPDQDQSKIKKLSRPTAASQQTWGKREGPFSCHSLPWGAPCPFRQQKHGKFVF